MKSIVSSTLKVIILIGALLLAFLIIDKMIVSYQVRQLNFAIRTATSDATSILKNEKISYFKNLNLDGEKNDENYFSVNNEKALNQFLRSLYFNISKEYLRHENIPIMGIVDYDGVQIYNWKNGWQIKENFNFTSKKKTYQFSLGNKVVIRNKLLNSKEEKDLNEIEIIQSDITNEELKNFVVMNVIMKELRNVGYEIPNCHFDVVEKGNQKFYNSNGNIVNSPCFFAIVDKISIGLKGEKYRSIKFGGSELSLK